MLEPSEAISPAFLEWMHQATQEFQKQYGREFTYNEQVDQLFEEVYELLQASTEEQAKLEFWDCIFSLFTLTHVLHWSDRDLMNALKQVMAKLEDRMKTGYYTKKQEGS